MFINRVFLILMLFFSSVLSLHAQTATEMDTLMNTEAVTAAAAARFILDAAELLPAELSGTAAEKAAFDMASSRGWLKGAAADSVTLKNTAYLLMKAFNLKGGILYSLFNSPRYAYREMIYRKLIPGRADPSMKVSGKKLLQIIDRVQSFSVEKERRQAMYSRGVGN